MTPIVMFNHANQQPQRKRKMAYSKMDAAVVAAACENFFLKKVEAALERYEEDLRRRVDKRRWFFGLIGPHWSQSSKDYEQARIFQAKFAVSDEYYGNREVRELLALARKSKVLNVPVEVSAKEASLIFPL